MTNRPIIWTFAVMAICAVSVMAFIVGYNFRARSLAKEYGSCNTLLVNAMEEWRVTRSGRTPSSLTADTVLLEGKLSSVYVSRRIKVCSMQQGEVLILASSVKPDKDDTCILLLTEKGNSPLGRMFVPYEAAMKQINE